MGADTVADWSPVQTAPFAATAATACLQPWHSNPTCIYCPFTLQYAGTLTSLMYSSATPLYHCRMVTRGVIMLHDNTSPNLVNTLEHAVPELIEGILSALYCLYLSPVTSMCLDPQEYITGPKIWAAKECQSCNGKIILCRVNPLAGVSFWLPPCSQRMWVYSFIQNNPWNLLHLYV